MPVSRIEKPGHVVVYYHLRGYNNNKGEPYRPDNPWGKMRNLFFAIDSDPDLRAHLGVETIYGPDKSVWRIRVPAGRSPAATAEAVLLEIESRVNLSDADTVMAVASGGTAGTLEEFIID